MIEHGGVIGHASSRLLYIWHPEESAQEEIEAGSDIGESPSGWCPKFCRCGEACGEFAGHRLPCACMGNEEGRE